MSSGTIWTEPKPVASIDDCYFDHTMNIRGHGTVNGEWDLRGRESACLGIVDSKGEHVLEVGTSSGHLCSAQEQTGADIVGDDQSEKQDRDIVSPDMEKFDDCTLSSIQLHLHDGKEIRLFTVVGRRTHAAR